MLNLLGCCYLADARCAVVQINQYVYIDKMINTTAFTYFSQIRVVNEETAYISPTNGEAENSSTCDFPNAWKF